MRFLFLLLILVPLISCRFIMNDNQNQFREAEARLDLMIEEIRENDANKANHLIELIPVQEPSPRARQERELDNQQNLQKFVSDYRKRFSSGSNSLFRPG